MPRSQSTMFARAATSPMAFRGSAPGMSQMLLNRPSGASTVFEAIDRPRGIALGLAIAVLGVAMAISFAISALRSSELGAAVVFGAAAAAAVSVALAGGAGTWWCSTFRYVLSPVTLDVCWGLSRLRIRYDQIERIGALSPAPDFDAPTAWPGLHVGWDSGSAGKPCCWRATSSVARKIIAIDAGGISLVLSPAHPVEFRDALIQCANATPFAREGRIMFPSSRIDWLSWGPGRLRLAALVTLIVASGPVLIDLLGLHTMPPTMMPALTAVIANLALAMALARRLPRLAQVVLITGLFCQVFVLLPPGSLVVQ